jgi:DNA-binding PadR family transcriptional regulator
MKPTHGYEIQKFLQVSNVDQWAKIQSGSIYYALTKLEKDKHIRVLREERTGSRVRKIYEITKSGKEELHLQMAEELDKPISNIGSMKFFTDPMLSTLNRDELIKIVTHHIVKLKEQKDYWEQWCAIKVDDSVPALNRLSFHMTIDSLGYQIRWHEELLTNLDYYISASKETEQIIKSIDFDLIEEKSSTTEEEQRLQYAIKLKNEILKDPENAVVNLDKIIGELQKQVKDQK